MATAKKPELHPVQHPFVRRRADSEWLGPADETCHYCGADPRNEVHALTPEQHDKIVEWLQVGLLTPEAFKPEPPITDESLIARNHALREALRNVLRLCVDRKQHAFADAQEALHVADALLVEEENRG